jgi:hypothetical protein
LPYQATYTVERNGKLVGLMQVVLEETGEGSYSYTMDSRLKWGMFHPHIQQSSRFDWVNETFKPVSFLSTQRAAFLSRKETVEFDWVILKATGRKKMRRFELDIKPGMQDKLTINLELARALCNGETHFDENVVSGPLLKPYIYKWQANESLQTEMGLLQVIHVRRGSSKTKKQTDSWHAKEARFLPVKIVYRNKGEESVARITAISFDNTQEVVSGATAATE